MVKVPLKSDFEYYTTKQTKLEQFFFKPTRTQLTNLYNTCTGSTKADHTIKFKSPPLLVLFSQERKDISGTGIGFFNTIILYYSNVC